MLFVEKNSTAIDIIKIYLVNRRGGTTDEAGRCHFSQSKFDSRTNLLNFTLYRNRVISVESIRS